MKSARTKANGFYADSLEMLLDTMCNVLGGILFITLTLAVLTRHNSTPESFHQQAIQLTNDLAEVASSNAIVEAKIQSSMEQLQTTQQPVATNLMRLPSQRPATRQSWFIVLRYGLAYPLSMPPVNARAALIKNTQTIDWRRSALEPKPGLGDDPARCVQAAVQAFTRISRTNNYYFVFLVYDDSFPAFNRAKELAFNLGMQYGWEPYTQDTLLKFRVSSQAQNILPQD